MTIAEQAREEQWIFGKWRVESDRWWSYLGIDGGWGRYTPGRPWVETYCPAAIGQAEMGMGI